MLQHTISIYKLAVALILLSASSISASQYSEIEASWMALDEYDIATFRERAIAGVAAEAGIVHKYKELGFDNYPPREVSDHDLTFLLKAARRVAFYNPGKNYHERVQEVFEEIVARGQVKSQHVWTMYRAWIADRVFDQARRLVATYPEIPLPPVPDLDQGNFDPQAGPSVLRVHDTEPILIRENVTIDTDYKIIVTASPSCRMTLEAIREIGADPVLRSIFLRRSIWLYPQSEHLQIEEIRSLNQRSWVRLGIIMDQGGEWPMIKYRGTPNFYLVEDGKTIKILRGWRSEVKTQLVELITQAEARRVKSGPPINPAAPHDYRSHQQATPKTAPGLPPLPAYIGERLSHRSQ